MTNSGCDHNTCIWKGITGLKFKKLQLQRHQIFFKLYGQTANMFSNKYICTQQLPVLQIKETKIFASCSVLTSY